MATALLGATGSAQALAPDVTPRAAVRISGGPLDAEGRAVAGPAARIEAGVTASWLLDSGVAIDAVLGGALEAEPRRGGWAPAAAAVAGPRLSPATRLAADPAARAGSGRAALEEAYLAVRGGWGEASVGRDVGVAARFSLPPPTILRAATTVDPLIDPTGLGGVRIRADLSGPSAKASVVSPRWLGVRVGGSYTPRTEGTNLDDPPVKSAAPRFRGRDIGEAGLSFDRTWRSGLQTTVGVGWARGAGGPAFGDVEMTSWGARVGGGGLSFGVAGRTAREDVAPRGETRSLAAGATYERGAWAFEASAARMRDEVAPITLRTATLAARRSLSDTATFAVVGSWGDRVDGAVTPEKSRVDGAKLEFSLDL
ncbi:MAG: porin [Alphaproteobacteria bacterium]|nr:porin [Alphaproteobacteria bacterium]